ncbi:MAG: AAA family ATPase [Flavobacteriales bacterium]|nr:AAA family ATPase [Flavobacteriales bacterium]MDW8431686.1 MoxR family ATPase [Flavobacteriales bacterium]
MPNYNNEKEAADAFKEKYAGLLAETAKVIVGQKRVLEALYNAIFCGGHVLLVGVPGLAKTLMVNTVAKVLGLDFNRIQFTPDLMPGDITGAEILDENRRFRFIKGPVFTNILLADEINRTPPKTQSALLEAMQEKAVTAAGQRYALSLPFFVLATQNPIEQEGTYPLPEAQMDRFMYYVTLDYPSFQEEVDIVRGTTGADIQEPKALMDAEEVIYFQKLVRKVPVPDNVVDYTVKLVHKTRPGTPAALKEVNEYLSWGAGPRASQNLILGAKCHAVLHGKYAPDIEDVQAVAFDVLRHRLIRNYKAEAASVTAEDLIRLLLN